MSHKFTPTPIVLKHPDKLFINGEWVLPHFSDQLQVIAPHTEEVIYKVAAADKKDMESAVNAARTAFDEGPWPRMTPVERAEMLTKMKEALLPRTSEIAAAWTEQIGTLAGASAFVTNGSIQLFDYYISMVENYPFEEKLSPTDGNGSAMIVREPVGVIATIAPWNNPFGIMVAKIVPALLTGCTVIMKPAPETPLDAYIIAEAAEEAGLPPGVINLVPADRDASDHLVQQPGVDKVNFTGSVIAGQRIGSVCGERIARCTLELGGKSPAIILDDADLAHTAKVLASTITMSAGQVCATLSRAIVSTKHHDELVDAVKEEMSRIKVGDPYDPETAMGPLAMARQRDRVENYIALGQKEGAQLVLGGKRPEALEKGFYIEPTLFTDVTSDMQIAQEEIFGPVLSVLTYEDEQEAIRIANDSDFGLYGAVFTRDADKAYRVARAVRSGTMSHNIFRFDPILPFGGFKQSGIGREGGVSAMHACTELKSILLDKSA